MSPPATIPVIVPPEVAARVAELGYEREFERMLEYPKTAIEHLDMVVTELDDGAGWLDGPQIIIEACIDDDSPPLDINQKWDRWFCETFPGDVHQWFIGFVLFRGNYARPGVP